MNRSKSLATEFVEVVLLALALYLVITFAVQTVHVIGLSMYSTLGDNDYLIATKIDYRFHGPSRGDIIIMRDPYDSSKDFIKRIVGLPGEKLLIQNGTIYINGRVLSEPYLRPDVSWTNNANYPVPATSGGTAQPLTIPDNSYFVMGDNRNASSDSRMFGPVARDRIEGRAWVRIWPLSGFGFIDRVKSTVSHNAAGLTPAL